MSGALVHGQGETQAEALRKLGEQVELAKLQNLLLDGEPQVNRDPKTNLWVAVARVAS